jgi:hypothetical protein
VQSLFPASCTKQVALHTSPPVNAQNITLGVELAFLIDIDQRPGTGRNWGWLPLPRTDFKGTWAGHHVSKCSRVTGNSNLGWIPSRCASMVSAS